MAKGRSRILAANYQPAARNIEKTIEWLIAVLDGNDLMVTISRVECELGLPNGNAASADSQEKVASDFISAG